MDWVKFNKIKEGLTFTLTDEQNDFLIRFITGNGHWALLGDAGCVDADTEFLTKNGWVNISNYKGQDIAVWDKDGKTVFEKPLDYVKLPAKTLNKIKTTTIDMEISDEHRVPHITSRGVFKVSRADELLKLKKVLVPRSFKLEGEGVPISDELIKVLIMQSADGSIVEKVSGNRIRINLKREDKIERAHNLLKGAGIEYTANIQPSSGLVAFYYQPPKGINFKGLASLYNMSKSQAELIYQEMLRWDGHIKSCGRKGFTGNRINAEIFQIAASTSTGKYCNMEEDTRDKYKSRIFEVRVSNRDSSVIELDKKGKPNPKSISNTKDGFKYCFTTRTSFWLARKNGKIFPTGNTGKSTIMQVLKMYYNHELVACGTTGVASVNLPNEMGVGTAHSLFNMPLSIAIESDWKKRPHDILSTSDLVNIVVVDEAFNHSAQELEFYLNQISKMNRKTRKRKERNIRLLLVGDPLQNIPISDDEQKLVYKDLYGSHLMFRSHSWKKAGIKSYVLQDVKRQSGSEPKDIWFRKALQVVRYGLSNHIDKVCEGLNRKLVGDGHGDDAVYIAPTNAMVNNYNDKYLQRNPNFKMTFEVEFDKKYNKKLFPMDWEVTLAEGCKVITLINEQTGAYQNGTVLTVTNMSVDGIYGVKDNGEEVFVPVHEFKEDEVYIAEEVDKEKSIVRQVQKRRHVASAYMLPVKLCAAFSCMRVQGRTFDFETVVDFGSNRQAWLYNKKGMEDFMTGGAFVALSRVTNIDHLKLKHKIHPFHIKTCQESKAFWFESLNEMKNYD